MRLPFCRSAYLSGRSQLRLRGYWPGDGCGRARQYTPASSLVSRRRITSGQPGVTLARMLVATAAHNGQSSDWQDCPAMTDVHPARGDALREGKM
jgi:hypothetical protein